MEELSAEELNAVLNAPQHRNRRTMNRDRSVREWFYHIQQEFGVCDNPDCKDDRDAREVPVWTDPDGNHMCRFCYLDGWLKK